jgi:hypothetical protein
VFKSYIDKIYNIKSNPKNSTQKALAKILLNNLLGRFGINLEKSVTDVMTNKEFETKSVMNKITSYKRISKEKVLVNYLPKLDFNLIEEHNLSMIKILNKYKDYEVQTLNVCSIVISAAITAYARIYMSKIKLDIIKNDGELYYSDTDSIITNKQLPNSMVSSKELGKLKLEHVIDKGIFISNKITAYGITMVNLSLRPKSYFDYLKLLNNININTSIKSESKIDWNLGQVEINDKFITIKSNSYINSNKVYNDNIRVNTLPLIININLSLVKYKEKKKNLYSLELW